MKQRLIQAPNAASDDDVVKPEVLGPGDGRAKINCASRQLRDLTAETLAALHSRACSNSLFLRGGVLTQVVRDERHRFVARRVSPPMLRGIASGAADFYSGSGPCFPPRDVMQDLLALPASAVRFPALEGIIEAPALRPDGSLITAPGYDRDTGLFLAPDPGLRVPHIPNRPSTQEMREAIATISDIVADFPFVDAASRANALAAILTPVIRPAITGPVPLALFDAPSAGTGKGLLADVASLIATGRVGALFSAPHAGEEWRKMLTSVLREGAPLVIIDNVCAPLKSPELCKALTAGFWADRLLGHGRTVQVPVRCAWIATGNNIQVASDMPRRCFWIRMDAKVGKPWERTGFKYPDLKNHVRDTRGELIGALLTIACGWFAAGCPAPTMTPFGSFESWANVTGGILENADVPDFLANREQMMMQVDGESCEWERFLLALADEFGAAPFTAAAVFRACSTSDAPLSQALPASIAESLSSDGSFQRRLGQCLSERAGRRFGESGVHVEKAGTEHHAVRWRVVRN